MSSVTRRGDRWRGRAYVGDRQVEKTFDTHDQAKAWATVLEAKVITGEVRDWSADVTFIEYAESFLAQADMKPSSAVMTEGRLRLHVYPTVGLLGLRHIRRSHCRQVVESCRSKGLAPRTVRAVVSAMSQVLALAVDDELIPANPATRLRLPKPETKRLWLITTEQVAAISERIDPALQAMVVLAVGSAMRSSEMRGLVAANVTPAPHVAGVTALGVPGVVHVGQAMSTAMVMDTPKSSSSVRDIPVTAEVVAALRGHVQEFGLGDGGLLFHRDGKPLTSRDVTQAWHRAAQGLELPAGEVWHSLRRYTASSWLSAGVSVAQVSKMLGHSSPSVTHNHYSFAIPSDTDRVLEVTAGLLAGLA